MSGCFDADLVQDGDGVLGHGSWRRGIESEGTKADLNVYIKVY